MRTTMDLEERLHQWLDEHGFQGSVTFNVSFFFLQLVFYSVIVCALIAATR
jgi:hypothetical protein